MPVAKYQSMIVIGRATIYRIRLVKLKSKNILPTKPQTREAALRAMHQCGSGKPIEYESCPGYAGS